MICITDKLLLMLFLIKLKGKRKNRSKSRLLNRIFGNKLKPTSMLKLSFIPKSRLNWETLLPIPTKKSLCLAKMVLVFKTTLSLYYIWLMNSNLNLKKWMELILLLKKTKRNLKTEIITNCACKFLFLINYKFFPIFHNWNS